MTPETGDPRSASLHSEVVRLRALVEASRVVHSSLDLDELLDNILSAATTTVGATRGTVYLCDHDKQELWSRVTAGSDRVEIRLPFGKGLAGFTAVSGEPLCVNDVRQSPLFDAAVDRRTGFRTENALCSPIRDREGAVAAVIQLLNKKGGFSEDDTDFLDGMGVHVAQALANARAQQLLVQQQKLVKELELARQIQELLLPGKLPRFEGIGVAAKMITSRAVGGDYYDVIRLDGQRHLFILADVSGKGVAASLVMSNLQAALWATAALGPALDQWAAHLNEVLYNRLGGSRYVTAFLAILDATTRRGQYLNAGHPPGLLWTPGSSRRLEATGPPLGLLPGQPYEAGGLELPDDGVLLLYSDGLTEAADAAGEELGVDGLEQLLAQHSVLGADALATRLIEDVSAFDRSNQEPDDRTVLLLRGREHPVVDAG